MQRKVHNLRKFVSRPLKKGQSARTYQDYPRLRIGIVELKRVKCCEVCYSMGISVTVWTFAPVAIAISVEDTYG